MRETSERLDASGDELAARRGGAEERPRAPKAAVEAAYAGREGGSRSAARKSGVVWRGED